MKRLIFLSLIPLLMLSSCRTSNQPTVRGDLTAEIPLIAVLQNAKAPKRAKADACARLKLLATAKSVPALAALLTDTNLAHSARYVLETIPDPKAGKALLHALPRTSGLLSVGIIDSLAARGETSAVPELGKLLVLADEEVAVAAAEALGRIGGGRALKILRHSVAHSKGARHDAEVDGILMCGNRLVEVGKPADALKVFHSIYATEKADKFRMAAYRGMILASEKNATTVLVDGIANGDAPTQAAALQIAFKVEGKETTLALAGLLPKASATVQKALVESLMQRNDPAAMPAVASLVGSLDADVRLAAITALGNLGDDSVVKLLAEKAASAKGAERDAARESLLELNRGQVTTALVGLLKTSSPKVEAEAFRALSGRGDQSAVPALLDLAQNGNDTERPAALQALGQLADASQIAKLLPLVVNAKDDQSRSDAADAINSVFQRIPAPSASDVAPLVAVVKSGSTDLKVALLPVFSSLAQADAREVVVAAVKDSDARVSEAGIHALGETRDPDLLPELLKLASEKSDSNVRQLAIRGTVRLTTQEEGVKFSNAQKLDALNQILGATLTTADKRLVLSGLSTVSDMRALRIATGMLEDAEVKPEAEQSIIKIAGSLSATNPAEAKAALQKIAATTNDPATIKSAQTALAKIK